jgi:transposase
MHLRQKLSIREIARLTGVSRNTVTKHLAANTIEPKFATPERPIKIDPGINRNPKPEMAHFSVKNPAQF